MKLTVKTALFSMAFAMTATAFSGIALACSENGKDGFLPPNRMYIPPRKLVLDARGNPVGGGITEAEFNGVISAVDKVYNPIVKSMGGNLVFHRNWTDGTVNAYADRQDGNWNISMFGGLARHKYTTVDGFLLVVCHELGHHIGGAPKIGGSGNEWASNEGQADYFSTLKCARRVLQNQDSIRRMRSLAAPDTVLKACRHDFRDTNQAAQCVRSSMAGFALAQLLGDLGGNANVSFDTPDTSKVTRTDDEHPEAQCRLDTYFAGATCDKDFMTDVSDTDPTVGTCSQEKRDPSSFRPRCWYAPADDNGGKRVNPRTPYRGRVM
ncbi:MAG: hypothetical protein H7301_00840 [Cryobacterium sp.]|nr:hypothetical protein [Oligoflexia bacterium]